MKKFLFVFLIFTIQDIIAQIDVTSQELGIEGYFGASNQSGSFAIGPKYGFILNENIAVGPSFRIQRNWSNNLGNSYAQTVYGGGAFAHIRYKSKGKSTVYGAVEFEYLRSPYSFATPNQQLTSKKWAPTLFLGGGFLIRVNKVIGINAGILYDLINAKNSPFRSSYFFKQKNQAGVVTKIYPVIYRLTFLFKIP
ncbi:MAG: hypothetical protein NTY55_05005 [Flavobacteriia bacterium]|jgi:hypothetical protein|nr:hypothetical protein [Flavobacteriia bacterium]